MGILTVNFGHGPRKHILLSFLFRNALQHIVNDGFDEPSLLVLLFLLLKAYPAVKHSLDLGGERDLLAPHKRVSLELCSLL